MDLTPNYKSNKFMCPHCRVVSQQHWFDANSASAAANSTIEHLFYESRHRMDSYAQTAIAQFIEALKAANDRHMTKFVPPTFSVATCTSCAEITLWIHREMVYPKTTPSAPPNEDMESAIKSLYNEAGSIVMDSPRGAAALLRLALQHLMVQLGEPGRNINDDIRSLVTKGLDPKIQKALDLLRVVGNNAVHPGRIDLDDGSSIALKLFDILNIIADDMITKPKNVATFYASVVPTETQESINKRDTKQMTP